MDSSRTPQATVRLWHLLTTIVLIGTLVGSVVFAFTPTEAATSVGAGNARNIPAAIDQAFYGLTTTNQLVQFTASQPANTSIPVLVTGLAANEQLVGIDYRPANGLLYGVGSTSRIYSINTTSGAATLVGTGPISPTLNGTAFGVDFNPAADRLRIVSNQGQNLRLVIGGATLLDGSLAYAAGDTHAGSAPTITSAAYTNNTAGVTSTVLYVLDTNFDSLAIQNPPNAGTLTTVGSLGANITNVNGFDIAQSGIAYGAFDLGSGLSQLGTINLTTGAFQSIGQIGIGISLRGLAAVLDVVGPPTPTATATNTAVPTATNTPTVPAQDFYGLTTNNELISFNSSTIGATGSPVAVTGLAANEQLVGIDYRPANGLLYGVGSTSRIYSINTTSGAATLVGTGPISPTLNGTAFGVDFNPVADRLRIVSNQGQNLRLVVGGATFVDGSLAYAAGDTHAGNAPTITSAAYTNNTAGVTSTVLYVLDTNFDSLAIQNPPNAGTLTTVGSLGANISNVNGFDIAQSGIAYGAFDLGSGLSQLGTINLTTGAFQPIGQIGSGVSLRGLAAVLTTVPTPTPTATTTATATSTATATATPNVPAQDFYGLTTNNELISFNSSTVGTTGSPVAVTGLAANEQLVGIDYRPANGLLYGVGSTSRIYSINTTSGAATLVGTGPISPTLNGTAFGVDFNPAADRLRIVSNQGQNLRLVIGGATFVDGSLAYAAGDTHAGSAPTITSAAYTNNTAGVTSTVLYVLDTNFDSLAIQNPPNAGTLTTVGSLGANITNVNGFDIAQSGIAYGAFDLGTGLSQLGTINLTTGAFQPIGQIGSGVSLRGLAAVLTTVPTPTPTATVTATATSTATATATATATSTATTTATATVTSTSTATATTTSTPTATASPTATATTSPTPVQQFLPYIAR